jgi:hypothetical protein
MIHKINMKDLFLISIFLTGCSGILIAQSKINNGDCIKPWSENPRFWQYKGMPVLLLGGSKTDHLFLAEGLREHLEEIHTTGANYVRNTMSQRQSPELKPHKLLPDGNFDLDQWNEEYWTRFSNMLEWTAERDIIVQIEIWDRFDYSRDNWLRSPWNPDCNINYSNAESGFAKEYTEHPYYDMHHFFHTVPGMRLYDPRLDMIREYQEKFVSKMLSYSLSYGNVLYCMNNETSTPAQWGQYWIRFIKSKAAQRGVTVFVTDMFGDAHLAERAEFTPLIFNDPDNYMFADLSQVNHLNFDDDHWDKIIWLIDQVNQGKPRPSNHTKIYGGGYLYFGTGGLEDGIERFWRNLLAGSASSRFHRPNAGNGLNEKAKASIRAARLLENTIKLWDVEPHMELLVDRQPNEAYLAALPGEQYALYFTYGGSVGLDLTASPGSFAIRWISITEGVLAREETIEGGEIVTLTAPFKGGWIAAITRADTGQILDTASHKK